MADWSPLSGSMKKDRVVMPVAVVATRLPISRSPAHDAKTLAWSLVTGLAI
jgi:hypothetical protein